jgi:hypothetical protein
MNLNKLLAGLAIVGATTALAATANAASLSFDEGAATQIGTVSYDGIGGALVGTGLNFTSITGDGTPLNSGVSLVCDGCLLNFETGVNISEGPSVWEFASGGSFTVTGLAKTGGGDVIANGILLQGSFTGTPLVSGAPGTAIFTGFGVDEKHQGLLDFFGITTSDFEFATTEISLSTCTDVSVGGFDCAVQNADLENTSVVPLPAAAWLFGSALLGLAGVARRKRA